MTNEYAAEQCDVVDKAKLSVYRKRRSEWIYQLVGDPDHSIWLQLCSMLWNDAIYRTVNEARRLAGERGGGSSALNGPLGRFIDQGFVATQTLSIRKLTEVGQPKKPDHQIISIRRIVDELAQNRHLLTRENYVAHDGLPYEFEVGERKFIEHVSQQRGVTSQWMDVSGPSAWSTSKMLHERFDSLCGTKDGARSRDDVIGDWVFERLHRTLSESGYHSIVKFGNKFVAHAADTHSRGLYQGAKGLSLDQLAFCHRALCKVAAAIYGPVLWGGSLGFMAVPQFDQFSGLTSPWLDPDDIGQLDAFWKSHVSSVEKWADDHIFSEDP